MKKFFLLFVMAVMTATVANAQTAIPSDEVLNRYRGDSTNVVIGAYVTASFCNDLVFSGTYNSYSSTLSDVVRFVPVDSFPDWYVCSFYDDGTNDFGYGICGKIVALRTDGSFEWSCQWGDYSQILRGSAYMEYEYGNEVVLRGIDTSAPVVLSVPSWKNNIDACAAKQSYTISLEAPFCVDENGNSFQPAVCGDFCNWAEPLPMTHVSGDSYVCTIEDYPGNTFKFLAVDVDNPSFLNWDNVIVVYSAAQGGWEDAPNVELGKKTAISCDLSDARYALCERPTPPDYLTMPYSAYYYGLTEEEFEVASCRLEGGTRNCRVEWGWIENYVDREKQPWLPGNSSDITKPEAVYHFLKQDTAYSIVDMNADGIQELVLQSRFNPTNYSGVSLDSRFYCRVYQEGILLNEQTFAYMNAYEIRRISIEVNDMEDLFRAGDTVNHFAIVGVIDGPESIGREGRINFYNALDTAATTPVSVFQNGNTYYAQLETPFDSLFAQQSVLTKNTMIAWYGGAPEWLMLLESTMGFGTPYDMSGRLRSPLFTVDEVSWYAAIIKEGDGIMIYAGMVINRDSVAIDTVRMEMSLDGDNWIPFSGDNIEVDGEGIYAYLESMAFRAGTYYFRFIGVTNIGTFTSNVYTVVIGGGINIDLENVAEGAVEYDAETNTVTISSAVIEEVETALTNLEADVTIALEGSTTIVAEETGILTSGDITIVGSYGEGYVSTDTMTITAPRPLVASAEGVKLTLDGVTLHLVNPNPPVPGEAAARRQLSPIARARYIAKTVLLTHNAEDESVISGFDEVDFINCGVIEPEGAEYNEENMELMVEGEPVYNCTIAPMETPVSEAIESVEAEKVSTDKQLRQGAIYILRQNRVYTVMGQLVK